MVNGEISEFRGINAYQSGFYFIESRTSAFSNSRRLSGYVWHFKNSSLSLFTAGKDQSAKNPHSRKLCGFYCQTASQFDQENKKYCEVSWNVDQQNGKNSAGRFFSNKGSWPKKGGKLKYHMYMIDWGSKSSLRFTIFLSVTII